MAIKAAIYAVNLLVTRTITRTSMVKAVIYAVL